METTVSRGMEMIWICLVDGVTRHSWTTSLRWPVTTEADPKAWLDSPDPAVRADDEDGEGRAAGRGHLVVDVHLVDLVVAVPEVGVAATDHGGHEDEQRAQRDDRPSCVAAPLGLPAAPGLGPAARSSRCGRRGRAGPTRWPRSLRRARRRRAVRHRCASGARARPAPLGSRLAPAPLGGAIRPVARRTTVRHGEERYQAPLPRWRQAVDGGPGARRAPRLSVVLVPGVSGLLELQRQRCIARGNDAPSTRTCTRSASSCTRKRLKWVMASRPTPHSVVACCRRRATSPSASTSRPESTSSRMQTAGRITPSWTISVRLRSPPERSTLSGRRSRRGSSPTALASSAMRSCSVGRGRGVRRPARSRRRRPRPAASAGPRRAPRRDAAGPGTARRGPAPRPGGRRARARPW